jgi:hypothetical protein
VTLSRRAARRTALFLLYQWDLTGQPIGTNYDGEIDDFARDLAESVAAPATGRRASSAHSSGTSCGSASTSSMKVRSRWKW